MRRVAVIGGQVGAARTALAGVIRYMSLHGGWDLHLRVWVGLPPCMTLKDLKGDGLLYLGPDYYPGAEDSQKTLEQIARLKIPAVYATPLMQGPKLPCVMSDERQVGKLQAEHLLEMGVVHLAYFADEYGIYNLQERTQGFLEAVRKAGRTCELYLEKRPWCKTDWNSLQRRLADWLKARPKPLGIGVSNDPRAAFLIHSCRVHGIRVPEEVAVVSAGNDLITCQCTRPDLTSVEPGPMRIGFEAASLLDRLIQGEPAPAQPLLILPLGVIKRGSTDSCAVGDALVADCIRHIRDHLAQGVVVKQLQRFANVSPRNLELRFRQALGRTPGAEIRRSQIERAKQLLAETDLSMGQIAPACGFSNQNRFGIVFRRLEKTTPTEFRQRMRQGNGNGSKHAQAAWL